MPGDLVEEFAITGGFHGVELPSDWNIAPTKEIYSIRASASGRELVNLSWGLIAPWSKDATEALRSQSMAINARTESVDEKPTFRSAFRSRRCLIPVTGYYEWATELGQYESKQPFYIRSQATWLDKRSGQLRPKSLACAGIFDRWVDERGEIHESAAIITREAVGELATVHHRMPTFLPEDRWDAWLDPAIREVSQIREIMNLEGSGRRPDENLVITPVSKLVNSTRNNGPELIAAIELGESQTLF
jgi:putative SOS response-associated peptidase YedK